VDFAIEHTSTLTLLAGRAHYEQVIGAVLQAERSVWIATANLKDLMVEDARAVPGRRRRAGGKGYRSVLQRFDELARAGVELRILHASLPSRPFRDSFDAHPLLVGGALQLRMCARLHLKTVIVDGRLLYLGSANWTGAGLGVKSSARRNFELGILSEDELLLDQVQALYQHIWQGSACVDCGLRDSCEAPLG
jgi:phosphatidylserine/phosphatidylglycerophosphate/cardiolipin synthase-like enzyme